MILRYTKLRLTVHSSFVLDGSNESSTFDVIAETVLAFYYSQI